MRTLAATYSSQRDKSDLQARREFERSAQRNRAEEAAKDAQGQPQIINSSASNTAANKPETKDDAR
jgi:hypothetical protein